MRCSDLGYLSNRREFNRTIFKLPFQARIESLTTCDEQFNCPIWILDMSAGGLKFVSKSEFKVNFIEIYKLNITLNNKDIVIYGKIIRKKILNQNFREYSVKFNFFYNEMYKQG
ncbi:PilZ domain-containing protein [Neobacillus sp. NPDC097160]|uniref:PilZ domain-containing protein n=1 Tax=Neobacillus sp. NPDC097160 TaxID=3364298 RepID=UPI0038116E76